MRFIRWLTLLLLCFLIIAPIALTLPPDDEDEKEKQSKIRYDSPFKLVTDFLVWPSRTDMGRVAVAVEQINNMDLNKLGPREVYHFYEQVPRDLVRRLSTEGIRFQGQLLKIQPHIRDHLAEVRTEMSREVWKNLGKRLKTDITILDYGNKAVGSGSDVDETGFLDPRDPRLKDVDVKDAYEQEWKNTFPDLPSPGGKADPTVMDVEIHDGRKWFPDVFGEENVGDFKMKYTDLVKNLKTNAGGYHFEGAVKMGVEHAAAEELEKFIRRTSDIKSQLEVEDLTKERRRRLESDLKLLEADNPVTKIVYNGADGSARVVRDADIADEILRLADPEVLRVYGCDNAWGNYLKGKACKDFIEGHKHIVRAFEKGACVAAGNHQVTDFVKLSQDEKVNLLKQLFPDAKGFSDRMREEALLVIDIATKLRYNHKRRGTTIPDSEIWGPLEQKLQADRARNRQGDTPLVQAGSGDARRWATEEYNTLAEKCMAWNNMIVAGQRGEAALNPDKLKSSPEFIALCRARGADPDVAAQKIQFASVCVLRDGFAHLPKNHVDLIINTLPEGEYKENLKLLREQVEVEMSRYGRLPDLDPKARSGLSKRFEDTHLKIMKEWVQKGYFDFRYALETGYYSDKAITQRVWMRIYGMLGYEYRYVFDTMETATDDSAPWDGMDRWERGEWDPDKAFAKIVNVNNLEAVLSVLRTWQQTGDSREVVRAIIWELLYEIPGISHAVALKEGLVNDRWQGMKVIASATFTQGMANYIYSQGWGCLVPYTGAIFVAIAAARTGVEIVGHEIFVPLREDLADMIYRGFSGPSDQMPVPPPEITDQEKDKLADLEKRLKETEKSLEKELEKSSAAPSGGKKKDLEKRMKDLMKEMEPLNDKRTAAGKEKEQENWRSGKIRTGTRELRLTSFDPVLAKVVPRFYVTKERGIIDLTAEPLTPREADRLESVNILLGQLREQPKGLNPIERAAQLADLLLERDRLFDKQYQHDRRIALQKEMDKSPGLLFEVRRQNVYYLIDPLVKEAMIKKGHPPEDQIRNFTEAQSQGYFKARKEEEEKVIFQYYKQWLAGLDVGGLDYGGHNRDAWEKAPKRVVPRMLADYRGSENLHRVVLDHQLKKIESMGLRHEKRRRDLLDGALYDAVTQTVKAYGWAMADYASVLMAHRPPAPKPLVKLTGAVFGEQAEREVAWRIKVIASRKAYPPPYTVELHATQVTEAEGENQKREIEARVYCVKEGKRILVGTAKVPVALEKISEAVEVEAAVEPLLEPRLRLEEFSGEFGPAGKKVRDRWYPLTGTLSPAGPGWHKVRVLVNSQRYTLWAYSAGQGGAAAFRAEVPVAFGTNRIEISAPDAEPISLEVEAECPYGPSETEAYLEHLAEFRRTLSGVDDPESRLGWKHQILMKGSAIVEDLYQRGRYDEAVKYADQFLAERMSEAEVQGTRHEGSQLWTLDEILKHKALSCIYIGNRDALVAATDARLDNLHQRAAILRKEAGAGDEVNPDNTYRLLTADLPRLIRGWVLLDGDEATGLRLFRLWMELNKKNNDDIDPMFMELWNLGPILEKENAVR